jgi:hypothetical protein
VNDPPIPDLLTVKEAAAYLSIQYKLFITSRTGAGSQRFTWADEGGSREPRLIRQFFE